MMLLLLAIVLMLAVTLLVDVGTIGFDDTLDVGWDGWNLRRRKK